MTLLRKPPIALALLVAGAPAHATGPFDGLWVADLDTQSGLSSDVYLVRDGRYTCRSCEPPRDYAADGRAHPVPRDPEVTWESVKITAPRTIVTHIVGPPLDRVTTMTVAPDGRTATYVSVDHRPGIGQALRTVYLARRTSPAPAGAHPVSGAWQGIRYVEVPALVRTTMLRVDGDLFRYSTPLGTGFTARLGGGYVRVRSGSGYMASVRRTGQRRIEERIREGGQVVAIRTFTVTPDGRSLEIATSDPAKGTTFRAVSRRR